MAAGAATTPEPGQQTRIAWGIVAWATSGLIAAFLVARHHNAVDVWCVYSSASRHWREHAPLYEFGDIDYFQYFPQAAIAFIPFDWLGHPWGDVAWRVVGWAMLGTGVWRSCGVVQPTSTHRLFWPTTALVIPPAMISFLNGQANLYLAALMLLAAVDLADRRRNRVTLWLTIGLALKPLMLVMIVFVCIADLAMVWRLVLSIALLVVVPFATAPFGYVVMQYRDCVRKLALSARPDRHFDDLRGLLWRLGWTAPFPLLRAGAAAAFVAAAAWSRHARRHLHAHDAALAVFAVAGCYLMLFNSRTQANSYVIVTPAAALAAAHFWQLRRWRIAAILTVIVASWCGSTTSLTESWLKPLTCAVFATMLLLRVRRVARTGSSLFGVAARS